MDNNGKGAGSFMAPAGGGGSALMRAMQRRGIVPGGSNQSVQNGVLPSPTPQGQPDMPHPSTFVPPQAQASIAAPQSGGMPVTQAPMPGQPTDQSTPLDTILEAMSGYIDSQNKINEAQAGVQ